MCAECIAWAWHRQQLIMGVCEWKRIEISAIHINIKREEGRAESGERREGVRDREKETGGEEKTEKKVG